MAAPRKRGGKVIVPNATVYDADLSLRALGLLMQYLARPAEASFDVRDIARDKDHRPGREGRDALLAARKELVDAGYVHQVKVKRGGRQGVVTMTCASDVPITADEARKRLGLFGDPALQESENPTPVTRTPVNPTALPTEGHPSISLRSSRGMNPTITRENCPNHCGPNGHYQVDENTVGRCPHHRANRRTA